MLVKILLGVAGVLVVFVAVAATRPSAYRVERKLELAAPADAVFGVLNDLHRFVGIWFMFGDPFEKRDPNMQQTFEGPAAGAGQSYSWSGKEAGKGKLTIEQSAPGQQVGMKLEFEKPMASTATYGLTLANTPTGSVVTWSMDGNHNFLGKAFGLFMNMDQALGGDMEKALAQLKTVVEGNQAAAEK
jgi:hypothetical protein